MRKSIAVTNRDFQSIHRLIDECRELGDDAFIWRSHLFKNLSKMTGAELVIGGEMSGCLTGNYLALGLCEYGFQNGFNYSGWMEACKALKEDPNYSTLLSTIVRNNAKDDSACVSRPEIVRDNDWYTSQYYNDFHKIIGVDVNLHCFHSIRGNLDECNALMLFRPIGEREFNTHQKRIVYLIHQNISLCIGEKLARFNEPTPSSLAPRIRHVLQCLLEGDGDKQIASRLGLSSHTVNQYTKQIYTFFGVHGRAELLAKWIKRNWGSKCAWVNLKDQRSISSGSN